MKIAMIGHKRVPSREGGIEIAVEELAIRLTAMGHQVDCYNRWQDFGAGAVRLPREHKGIRLIRIPTLATPSLNAFIYSVLAVLRALAGGYDVMHFHAEGPCAMTFLPRLFGIPVVSTIHGLDWQRAKWGRFASRYLLWGERNAARYSDALIVLSNGNQQYFTQTYGRETIYIPNGVSLIPCWEPEEIGRRWNLSKNSYILFLSRLVPEKGLHYLIGAYKKMDTDKRLVIAGGLTRNNEYVRQIRGMAEDDPRILFTDFVQGRVLEELMSNCCVYVLPSDIEGMSISLLEAMSCGVRCLVSDIEENVDVSGGYAASFPKGNIAMLQSCLERILGEDGRLHDREGQIAFIREKYSWDYAAAEHLRVYEQAAEKKQSRKKLK